jgi:hypothetical protein
MECLTGDEPTLVPAGHLEVSGLEDVSFRDLAERREWLLRAIGSTEPGADHPGVRAATLVLVAVIAELDTRARRFTASRRRSYGCLCGFRCEGLASFEEHLDQFPPEGPDGETHYEIAEAFLAERAARTGESGGHDAVRR